MPRNVNIINQLVLQLSKGDIIVRPDLLPMALDMGSRSNENRTYLNIPNGNGLFNGIRRLYPDLFKKLEGKTDKNGRQKYKVTKTLSDDDLVWIKKQGK